jgi:hypothetical protein
VNFLQSPRTRRGLSLLNSPVQLEKLARKVGWMKRKARKLTPIRFIRGILLAASQGESSLRLLASSIGLHFDQTVSKQALWERVGPEAVEMFKELLGTLLCSRATGSGSLSAIPGVRRILIQDSSLITLDEELAHRFPASANQHGHQGAGLRLQAVMDLISGQALDLAVGPYGRNDQTAALDILSLVQPGDLVIRDLGYLVAQSLEQITRCGAHFLSRHLVSRVLHHTSENGAGRIDLLEYLRRHAPLQGEQIDLDVVVGSGQKGASRLPCRLVARRLPQSAINARLRKAHQDEKRRNRKFPKRYLELLAWETYLTSLPRSEVDVAKIVQLYRLRWRIEIIFKALKSYTPGMKLARHRSNPYHLQVMVLAWLCLVVLATRTGSFALAVASDAGSGLAPNCLSLLKTAARVFQLMGVLLFMACAPDPNVLIERWKRQMTYHDQYERRNNRKNMAQLLDQALELS